MKEKSFIKDLQRVRSEYSNPGQARTQAQSLIQLSSGIYTEDERFVFELLQNAVDAYSGRMCLNVKILLQSNYLIFMHNGDAFTERDIEGLCDVGNGNKVRDTKKIGYKGIGFKSVFMLSKNVTVQSGNYCFRFERDYWNNYWDEKWGTKDPSKDYMMPWQIIPIESEAPVNIGHDGFSVVTYIQTDKTNTLLGKIRTLLSSSDFLLFLRHNNINIELYHEQEYLMNVSKSTQNNVVELSTNGKVDSRWLVYCNPEVRVSNEVKSAIQTDGKTPLKLQSVESFDLSFAVPLNDKGQIKKLEKSCVYTYLPTSISFGLPFLVNANFITDAGRQHLVNDSEWNKMIIQSIPFEFFNWMREVSLKMKGYYYALPSYIASNDILSETFNDSLKKAVNEIAFIPSLKGNLLKAKEAIMDRVGISSVITPSLLLKHINSHYDCSFTTSSFIAQGGISVLREYGVFDFYTDKLKTLFEDENAFAGIKLEKDIDLIKFLHKFYEEAGKDKAEIKGILKEVRFLYAEDDQLDSPENLFLPSSFREENSVAEGARVMHPDLFNNLNQDSSIIAWLKEIGLSEMNEISIIENLLCGEGYINEDNAIEVVQYIFDVWKNNKSFDSVSTYRFGCLKFLTKKGDLKYARDLYLGSKYFPYLDIEAKCDIDMFVSEDYCDSPYESDRREWRRFLVEIGIADDITLKLLRYESNSEVYELLESHVEFAKKHEHNTSWAGYNYYMHFEHIQVKYVPYLSVKNEHFGLSKLIWSKILVEGVTLSRNDDFIFGSTGCGFVKTAYLCDCSDEHQYLGMNFLPWMIKNHLKFPSSDGMMRMSEELFLKTPVVEELFGSYLPYLDVDCEIDSSWLPMLNLKQAPSLNDYLELLSNIASDSSKGRENKERVSKIYQKIVEDCSLTSQANIDFIKTWAKSNKILSAEGVFLKPKNLRYITLDGFSNQHRAYIGNPTNREKVIELLSLMGVSIITEKSVKPQIEGKEEKNDIKDCLICKSNVLSLLKCGESPSKQQFANKLNSLESLLSKTNFYHCKSIKLSYGDDNDVIEKTTFGTDNDFFYTGDLSLSKIDSLVSPICTFLGLVNKERELLVVMFENMDSIRDYLKEKEYDVSFIEDEIEAPNIFDPTINIDRNYDQVRRDKLTGYRGEIIVYEKLRELGFSPTCYSISDKNDYEDIIEYKTKKYYCKPNYDDHDISFTSKNGYKVLVEVKSTIVSKEDQTNMPISYREISLVDKCESIQDSKYLIVRVFNVNSTNPDIYMFNGHTLEADHISETIG